ncbi:MAG: M48 family metallopeptidase [Candidatus Omnitrophota bacterium]
MTGVITKDIQGIGDVLFVRSRRAKYLNIFVFPFKGVRVAIPAGISFVNAERAVLERISWIRKQLFKIKKWEKEYNAPALKNSSGINKTEAGETLKSRTRELAEKYGFSCNRIFIRNQKTRWGSCSSRNNINLNIKLALLPEDLADYVIMHELAHTRHKNHGKNFWAELDKYFGNAKNIDSRLRKYHIGLI